MADVTLIEQRDFGLASVLAQSSALPSPEGEGLDVFWAVAPGQWLAYVDGAAPDWADGLGERLAGVATVVDQSSAYVMWTVIGADARRLLQKGLPVDLSTLGPGAVIVSAIAHVGVIVHGRADGGFDLAVFRSFAFSLREWLDATIAGLPF